MNVRPLIPLIVCLLGAAAAPCAAYAESLYKEGTYRQLTSDNKAFRVGDVITVQVYENSSATTSTDTTSQRKNNLNVAVNTLLTGRQVGGGASVAGDFDGGGTTQRANKLLATITVAVQDVLPNGDLRIGGEQLLMVNDEQHKVSLEGRVRPQDISDGNVVLSTRLAEAHINYVGEGELSDRQRRAWWRKLLDLLGL
ncbi:flagellar basal body L-ring protein FlgH [Ralstonia pseudosolanacearum]|uniref:flagellar basal body L-ring protein FlgH n=1 Tax=Ralstonia pseudosolanacearum TaxID=1310165 RepID=UPI003D066E4B